MRLYIHGFELDFGFVLVRVFFVVASFYALGSEYNHDDDTKRLSKLSIFTT